MKMPRWLLNLLFAAIPIGPAIAAAWWWVTWPERVACEFVELMRAENIGEANRMMKQCGVTVWNGEIYSRNPGSASWNSDSLLTNSRSISDVLSGKCRFRVLGLGYRFSVQWGWVYEEGDGAWVDFDPDAEPERLYRLFGLNTETQDTKSNENQ
jgi:hypothetical protein